MFKVAILISWAFAAAAFAIIVYLSADQWAEGRKRKVADELAQVKRSSRPPVHEGNFFYIIWTGFAFTFVFFYWLSSSLVLSLAAGFAWMFLPGIYVKKWKATRREKLEAQLPEVIRSISSGLKAGRSFQMAVDITGRTFPEPARSEFTLLSLQMKVGALPEEALSEMAERTGSQDVILLSAAVEASRKAGGNLSQVLETLADLIRRRLEVMGKVKALSSQGRAQAWVLGSLPCFMLALLFFLDREMLSVTFSHPLGISLFAVAALLEIAGIFLMRRILNLEV